MLPILREGDVVFLKNISFKYIKLNDIICVKKNGILFTHKVVYKCETFLVSKGNNSLQSDGKVYPRNILGIARKFQRKNEIFDIEDIYLMQSTFYFSEIVRIKRCLETEGIKFIVLKGLPLHMYYEKKHPRRIYADCDILINREQIGQVNLIFKKMGYKKKEKHLFKKLKGSEINEQEVSHVKKLNGIVIEFDVHLEAVFMMTAAGSFKALYPISLLDRLTTKFLDEKIEIKIDDESFPVLSKESLFIYLGLHLFHHNFEGAYRYDFYKTVIEKSKIDYDKAIADINSFKLSNYIFPALYQLNQYYGVKIPRTFLNSMKVSAKTKRFAKNFKFMDIFNDKGRVANGILRFKNIYAFSTENFYKKAIVLADPKVLASFIWVVLVRLGIINPRNKTAI